MSTKLERISKPARENRELKFLSIAHLLTRTVRERLVEMMERRVKRAPSEARSPEGYRGSLKGGGGESNVRNPVR